MRAILVGLIPVVLLVICGISIKYFKAYWLISGYNTMSKERQQNVDVEKLGILMGNFCFVMAFLIFAEIILLQYKMTTLTFIPIIVLIISIIYMVVAAQKYDKNALSSDGTLKKSTKLKIGATIVGLCFVIIGVGVLLKFSATQAEYSLTQQGLQIKGMYGTFVKFSDINDVEILEGLPNISYRSNGSALGSMLKGHFVLKDKREALLFVDASKSPFIYITTNNQFIILNYQDRTATENLYKMIDETKAKLIK